MTAGTKKCVCGHRQAAHRDYRHNCSALWCWCTAFVRRDDTEMILALLESIDAKADQ